MFVEGALHPEQVKVLRKMSLQRRAERALAFLRSARRLKAVGLRAQHPGWSDAQIAAELRRLTGDGRS